MEPQKEETHKEGLIRLQAIAKSMSQSQIDACAWLMGGGMGWTPETLALGYQSYIDTCRS
jgi:hypothetical protein